MSFLIGNVPLKKQFFILFSILGPGLIAAFAGNDAGGITTYSVAGASFGYKTLWVLFLITFTLAMVQEMCARMGVVTKKGLSDLIRENFGIKWTLVAMLTLLLANIAVTVSEFAGIAASVDIFGVNKYISVPVVAFLIWLLVLRRSYKEVERVFLVVCLVFITYIISGIIVKPDWGEVVYGTFIPTLYMNSTYILLLIGVIGTTITPWMQFFIQSSVVEKGIDIKYYMYEKFDVFVGAFLTNFVAFFIIVACGATLFKYGIRIEWAQDAALALAPVAGKYAQILFAIGLFAASTLGATILPLSTSYAVCEAFGFENGINRKLKEAPVFFFLYTVLILIGVFVVLFSKISMVRIMLFSQYINGFLLPIILVFMLLLVNNKRLMGRHINSPVYNVVVWITVGGIIILALAFILISLLK